jgi:type II secretory pathway pseudopilin PulG
MKRLRRDRKRRQGGFALLLIFAFAAAVAIGIYAELPRAVFESARAKEELLVERGEQYKLAIRRYYAKNKTYPQTIEQLEETNGVRFLRQRYKDPMTGKDDWRLIHIGPGGYTDSKVFKPQNPAENKQVYQSSITEGYSVGQAPPAAAEAGIQGVAMRQRPSDQARPGQELPEPRSPDDRGAEEAEIGGVPAAGPPGPDGPDAEEQPPNPGAPVSPPPPPDSQIPALPAPPPPPGNSFNPGAPNPGTLPPGVGPGGGFPGPAQTLPGQGPANPALQQIQNLLTSPRPNTGGGPVPGPVPTGAMGAPPGAAFVGGIAGVASKYEGEGIKRIHDRSRIDEWEFLFDASKQPAQNQPGAPAQNQPSGGAPAPPPSPGVAGRPAPTLATPPGASGAGGFGAGSFGSGSFGSGGTSFGPPPPPPGQQKPPSAPGGNRPRP